MKVHGPSAAWTIGADSEVDLGSTLVPEDRKPTVFSVAAIPGMIMPWAAAFEIWACHPQRTRKADSLCSLSRFIFSSWAGQPSRLVNGSVSGEETNQTRQTLRGTDGGQAAGGSPAKELFSGLSSRIMAAAGAT